MSKESLTHQCAVEGCQRTIALREALCFKHSYKLPPALRDTLRAERWAKLQDQPNSYAFHLDKALTVVAARAR